jgi:hypothetical protein
VAFAGYAVAHFHWQWLITFFIATVNAGVKGLIGDLVGYETGWGKVIHVCFIWNDSSQVN